MFSEFNPKIFIFRVMAKRKLNSEIGSERKKIKSRHWSLGLLEAVKEPKYLVQEDSDTYVIRDKFPKAKHHFLVISKKDISSVSDVTRNDVDLLRHMEGVARKITKDLNVSQESYNFKIGYHAQPSMARLHLHIISDDMNSTHLKTKKHWNSFTTNFFIPSENIIASLVEDGRLSLPVDQQCKTYLKQDLKCNKCEYTPKNIPALKKHILEHLEH